MEFSTQISVGDVLTAATVAISTLGLIITWHKHRALQRKEFANHIRQSLGLVVAKI